MNIIDNLNKIKRSIPDTVKLVAVSKTKPASMILELFRVGQIDFGENKVQDLLAKQEELPDEIRWHMIGHLQTNKVKYIAPFVHMIHGVDSLKLLETIDKEGKKNGRVISCLMQLHIASEETKFGLSEEELEEILSSAEYKNLQFVSLLGLMGMSTFTEDSEKVRSEFRNLKRIFEKVKEKHFASESGFSILSMGMSDDYTIAVEEGSNMIRVGSSIFGNRNY